MSKNKIRKKRSSSPATKNLGTKRAGKKNLYIILCMSVIGTVLLIYNLG